MTFSMMQFRQRRRVAIFLVAWRVIAASALMAAEPIDVSADLVAVAKQHKVHGLAVAVIEGGQAHEAGRDGDQGERA